MLKRFQGYLQAAIVCLVMVALVFSIPMVLSAAPVRVDLSVVSWKQFLPGHQPARGSLSFGGRS